MGNLGGEGWVGEDTGHDVVGDLVHIERTGEFDLYVMRELMVGPRVVGALTIVAIGSVTRW